MEENFNDMASMEAMRPKPSSHYEEFVSDNFYHDIFSQYKKKDLTPLECSTIEISHFWGETKKNIDEHIAIIKDRLEKFAKENNDMLLQINSDRISEFYRKEKHTYRFKSIYIHNNTFKVILTDGKSEKEAYLNLNETIREQMMGFVLLNKALKDYYVSNRLIIPEWQELYYSKIAIIFSLLHNFALSIKDSLMIDKRVIPDIYTFLSNIASFFTAPEDTIEQYELCRIFVTNVKNHMFLEVVANSVLLNEFKKEPIQNIIQYLSHYERNNTKYNDELKAKYNIKTNKDDKLISETPTIAEALKSFNYMEKLDLTKETENTLVEKCLKVYEWSEVSTRLIPNHMEKDKTYNKSKIIVKTIKVKNILGLNKNNATVIAEVMTFIPSKNQLFFNENEVVKLDNDTCNVISEEEYKQIKINTQYSMRYQDPEPIQTVISEYNSYDNVSKSIDTTPTYVTTSTDDNYGKSSIKHFKSWDEECESSNQTIDDYDNGIKHFQD